MPEYYRHTGVFIMNARYAYLLYDDYSWFVRIWVRLWVHVRLRVV